MEMTEVPKSFFASVFTDKTCSQCTTDKTCTVCTSTYWEGDGEYGAQQFRDYLEKLQKFNLWEEVGADRDGRCDCDVCRWKIMTTRRGS